MDGKQAGTFKVGLGPYSVAFDGADIWVGNAGDGTVTKLRASDGAVLGTFTVGDAPYGLAFDGANIWAAASSVVRELRKSDGAILFTFPLLPCCSYGAAFDGANIWVTHGHSDVSKLQTALIE